jgi:hypothetical protein
MRLPEPIISAVFRVFFPIFGENSGAEILYGGRKSVKIGEKSGNSAGFGAVLAVFLAIWGANSIAW